jgi:hypothetical protein
MKVYPKVSGLATWSENCKWYSSLPLGAVVWLFALFTKGICRPFSISLDRSTSMGEVDGLSLIIDLMFQHSHHDSIEVRR